MREQKGLHVAAIMDGNGRWAQSRNLPRSMGHRRGVLALQQLLMGCQNLSIATLTLYAFSSDNWKRPQNEVNTLMKLLQSWLKKEGMRAKEQGICVNVIGRRDRLPNQVLAQIEATEALTAHGQNLVLRLLVDYSARDAITRAAQRCHTQHDEQTFHKLVQQVDHATVLVPPIDILIRTGGEQRLSDFSLWEAAYAELFFLEKYWPDFNAQDLAQIVWQFKHRNRRFGGLVSA